MGLPPLAALSVTDFVLLVAGATFVIGVLVRRWWLLWAVAALAATHAISIPLTGQATAEDSAFDLVIISAFFVYPPALFGAYAGVVIGRLLLGRRTGGDENSKRRGGNLDPDGGARPPTP